MEFHPFLLMLQCVWVLFFMFHCQGSLGCVDEERTALLEIKASVWYNDLLSTWVENRTSSYCRWEYIECSKTTGCVSRLNLAAVFSTGRSNGHPLLNASLFLPFKDLQHLDISDNGFVSCEYNQGIEKLSNLKKLQILGIGGNHFNSNVLEPLSELTSLKTLNLSHNDIGAGSFLDIPKGFCELKRLQGIIFSSNELKGKIPPCLKNFTSLRLLDLSSNQLSGNIPPSLTSNMSSLRELNLSVNQLTGSIPPLLLYNLTSFRVLDFSENQLGGSIPPLLMFNMKSLYGLSFTNNHLDGTTLMTSLPPQKSQLNFLGLGNCNLNISTEVLLTFLHLQRNLRYIDLSHNNISGKFPAWLLDNNSRFDTFLVRNNSISGHIQFPVHTTNLTWIDISDNQVEGCLTKSVGDNLRRVTYLNFSNNRLDGEIPTSLVNMVSLTTLDMSKNNFTGEVPESLALLPNLEYLILSDNRLQGQISPLLFNFTHMGTLLLSNNQFTGFLPIPNNKIGSYRFETLDVSHNNISGGIPTWIANLTSLRILVMGDNSFNGPIPFELCNLGSLEFLELSYNDFSGSIPPCLNLPGLKYLHLQENKLSGTIPAALSRSLDLVTLDLNGNKFSGGIPGWIGSLQGLRLLLLKGNRLSGFLPKDLCKLNKIGILDLSYNGFSGSIPPCFSNITFGKTHGIELDAEASLATMLFKFPVPPSYLLPHYKFDSFVRQVVDFVIKSVSRSYKGVALKNMGGIDLSCNSFTGEISPELGALVGIRALNLSYNQFTGSIPTTLSKLKQLESMDLSHNRLSGKIPSELIDINTLEVFLVAYNNLSGPLPDMKRQFATFTETSYEGNPFLCGPPLQKKCNNTASTGSAPVPVLVAGLSDKFGVDADSFLASCASAYISSFLGLLIVLYINPHWRRVWFDFIDACLSFMFPFWSEAIYRVSNP